MLLSPLGMTTVTLKLNEIDVPQSDYVRYLGIQLDRHLTWKNHIFAKRKQLGLQLRKIYWINSKSSLNINNKLLLYKSILKPIWTYGIQLWGTASHSNIEIIKISVQDAKDCNQCSMVYY